jgi:RNA-directed DNA polymerase
LTLAPDKTRITQIEEGFDFLGQTIRKYRAGRQTKFLIQPAKKNVRSLLEKVRAIVKEHRQATANALIQNLNPLIRGWAHYHQHVVSKRAFTTVDHAVFAQVWRWARRRQPNKSAGWVRRRYFQPVDGQAWVFRGEILNDEGQPRPVRLFQASRVPIRRHTKVKGAANPFDPEWEAYFEARLGVKMSSTLRGRRQLLWLWREQKGICPVCEQQITELTGWHNHQITWRTHGGSDRAENRVLLHPTCHQQVHSQGITVAKPRSDNER